MVQLAKRHDGGDARARELVRCQGRGRRLHTRPRQVEAAAAAREQVGHERPALRPAGHHEARTGAGRRVRRQAPAQHLDPVVLVPADGFGAAVGVVGDGLEAAGLVTAVGRGDIVADGIGDARLEAWDRLPVTADQEDLDRVAGGVVGGGGGARGGSDEYGRVAHYYGLADYFVITDYSSKRLLERPTLYYKAHLHPCKY